ncbi:MAG: DUF5666 domain-containing protein [Capsulimonadaceae bacterium]|nr:DUF5666 domain-containing protein [Capsulimonadaceae bacterium]
MKYLLALVVLTALMAIPSLSAAPDSVTFVGEHYEGVVTQVDATAGSGLLTTRFAERSLAFKITPDTRIWKTVRLGANSLQPGQQVIIVGRKLAQEDVLSPFLIDILPGLPQPGHGPGVRGARDVVVFGTIASTGDNLLVTDRTGKPVTVEVRGSRTLVGQTVPGDASDLVNGVSVKIDGKVENNVLTAIRIVLNVSLRRGPDGLRGKPPVATAQPVAITEDDISLYDLL